MTLLDDRLKTKERHERYRAAAARLYPRASFRNLVSVNETADLDGAFIEMTVWVSRKDLFVPDYVVKLKKLRKRKHKIGSKK